MQLSRPGLILESVSASAVVLSLLFVGLQLKQANELARAEAIFNISQLFNELNVARATDPQLVELLLRVNEAPPAGTTELDRRRATSWAVAWLNAYNTAQNFNREGILSDRDLDEYVVSACATLEAWPYMRAVWQSFRTGFDPRIFRLLEAGCPEFLIPVPKDQTLPESGS